MAIGSSAKGPSEEELISSTDSYKQDVKHWKPQASCKMAQSAVGLDRMSRPRFTPIFTVAGNKETAAAAKCLIQLPIAVAAVKTSTLFLQGNLTGLVPSASFHMTEPVHGSKMADPKFSEPTHFDVILGAELYESLRLPGKERSGEIVVTNTVFGYVASGQCQMGHYHVQLSIQFKDLMMI